MSVLTSFLSELPDQIGPIVADIERTCGELALAVADSTHRIRIYYLQIETLLNLAERSNAQVPHRRYTSIGDLEELAANLAKSQLSPTESQAARAIRTRARGNLVAVYRLVAGSQKHIEAVRSSIEDLRRTTRMSRYVSQCVRVEVSQVSGQADALRASPTKWRPPWMSLRSGSTLWAICREMAAHYWERSPKESARMKSEILFEQPGHKWVVIARDPERREEIIDTNEFADHHGRRNASSGSRWNRDFSQGSVGACAVRESR